MNGGTEARKCVKIVNFQKKMCELHAKCVMLGRFADCIELSDCKARLEVKLCLESAITNEKCQVLDPPKHEHC